MTRSAIATESVGPGPSHGGRPLRVSVLEPLLTHAGGRFVERCGVPHVADYGSTASEVALCRGGVGIADRSELVKLELHDQPDALARLVQRHVGISPVAGVPVRTGEGTHWCLQEDGRLLILADPCQGERLLRVLESSTQRTGAKPLDVSAALAAIALVGPRAPELLAAAGAGAAELPPEPGFATVLLEDEPALLLREAGSQFLAVVRAGAAVELWRALHDAGRELDAGCVGSLALAQLAVGTRTTARQG